VSQRAVGGGTRAERTPVDRVNRLTGCGAARRYLSVRRSRKAEGDAEHATQPDQPAHVTPWAQEDAARCDRWVRAGTQTPIGTPKSRGNRRSSPRRAAA